MSRNNLRPLNWKILLPLLILAGAGLTFGGLMIFKEQPAHKDDVGKAPLVSVKPLTFEGRDLEVRSQGVFKSQYQTILVAQVSGELVTLAPEFERGGIVQKGALLAQIDPFNYEVQLEEAKAQLAAAKAALILEEAQGEVARAEWTKIDDSAPTDLSLRKPQFEQAKARVRAAEAGVKQATKNLERTRIVAPFDALVAERLVSLGTFVGTGTHLGQVLDVSRGEVRLPVPGKDLKFLANNGLGAAVSLSMSLGDDLVERNAKIVRSEGQIDESSRMIYLVAEVLDPYALNSGKSAHLPFGAYVSARIQGKHLEDVVVLPRQLIDKDRVAIFSDDKLVFRKVEIIRVEGNAAIVSGELNEGENVITSSLQYPIEGMSLELLESPTETDVESLVQDKESAKASKGTF